VRYYLLIRKIIVHAAFFLIYQFFFNPLTHAEFLGYFFKNLDLSYVISKFDIVGLFFEQIACSIENSKYIHSFLPDLKIGIHSELMYIENIFME